jgi:hypothetical protein
MDDDANVLSSGQDGPDENSDSPEDAGLVVLDLAAAADLLNITEDGVRKRIARGKIDATKVDGRWQIVLRLPLSGGQDRPSSAGQTRQTQGRTDRTDNRTDMSILSPNDQLALFRDTFVMPLVAQVRELEHRLADTENARDQAIARADEAQQERDELVALLDRVHAERDVPVAANKRLDEAMSATTTDDAARSDASFWRRFWRALTGRP